MIGADRNAWLPRDTALRLAAEAFEVPVTEVRSASKRRELLHARALFLVAVERHGRRVSMAQIGRELGGRTGWTIGNLRRVARRLERAEPGFARACDELSERAFPQFVRAHSPSSAKESTDARH